MRWCPFAVLLVTSTLLAAQTTPARIPDLHGITLAGEAVDLPAALQGKAGVLIVGFSRDSRAEATRWGKRLATDFGRSPDIAYFELPVLEDVPRFLRSVVLRAIARDVSPAGQAHFLPISNNEIAWKSVVHFADQNAAYVLVVDSCGGVQWQTSGDATDEHYRDLRHAISGLLTRRTAAGRATP